MSDPRRCVLRPWTGLVLAIGILISACGDFSSGTPGPAAVDDGDGRATIQDRTGKVWDVTHARDRYGLNPSSFQFGLGPRAIRPIMNPAMLEPGDRGYPQSFSDFFVLGTRLGGSARAYRIRDLARHEVANERFGDAHVAVAY